MIRVLHRLSAFFFYLFGVSFFIAYVLLKNKLWWAESSMWMQIADLPLAFSAVVYGGLSLYLSVQSGNSKILPWLIGMPLSIFFGLILLLNFWPS